MRWMKQSLVVIFALGVAGCAHIPPQSTELSGQLSSQIADMQKAHIAAVNLYFDEVEQRVRTTMLTQYKNDVVEKMKEKQKAKGQELTLDQYDMIMSSVMKRLSDSLADLQKQRSDALAALSNGYVTMQAESETIHNLLVSASKLEEQRQRYTGVTEKKINDATRYLEGADAKAQGYLQEAQKVKSDVNAIKNDAGEMINGQPR